MQEDAAVGVHRGGVRVDIRQPELPGWRRHATEPEAGVARPPREPVGEGERRIDPRLTDERDGVVGRGRVGVREEVSVDTSDVVEIRGALTLYMDFINLFLNLLQLFGDRK